jgi:putative endonuclease
MFVIYAIKSLTTNRIYIGYTQDLDKRLKYHNSGYVKSTAEDKPWEMIALERIKYRNEARWKERLLKMSKGKRIKWIHHNRIKA